MYNEAGFTHANYRKEIRRGILLFPGKDKKEELCLTVYCRRGLMNGKCQ